MVSNIVDVFNDYFEMVPAVSDELKKEVYRLRYQVYCIETGFEDPKQYPDEMEFDEFDSHSAHYLIYHRKLEIYMATTRLILPEAKNPNKLFPIEIHSQITNFDALKHISRNHLAEASRFCVSKAFRRRKNEMNTITGINTRISTRDDSGIDAKLENVFTQEERRVFPNITQALFACLIKMSYENDIKDWYAVMEPALIRVFSTFGMSFIEIGPLVDYHGKRRPCTIKVNDLLEGVAEKDLNIWNMLTNKGEILNY
jgi:N-acyl amino acid synthase of PEP-CTERM/exosortase system